MALKQITSRLALRATPLIRLKPNKTVNLGWRGFSAAPQQVQPSITASAALLQRKRLYSTISSALYGEGSSIDASKKNILPEFDLKGKVVVVSGGAQGLGLALSEALIEAGATVHALDLQDKPETEDFQRVASLSLSLNDKEFVYHRIDVTHRLQVDQTFAEISEAEEGHIDGVLAAAGIQNICPALEYKSEDFDKMLRVNVTGCFNVARAGAKQMVEAGNGGSILMIASMSGSIANKGLICPAYNASKAAVVQLGRNLASEWGVHNIRVNTLSPGYIRTNMLTSLFDSHPGMEQQWEGDNMLGRLSTPDEYRGAAVFLMSKASSFMTGADLKIDGGHTAW
ncbi:NAD(P)-binding protein [Ascobolus immersus RN42]|uniref:NAD(P)-binding protein n=1 Tax=Ascobolus immersus RN42 TaxID=1160509 RepID=A0A3N4IPE9_ASCIM|nr:NAD(P)-binding protein [Ascobolus immersus RN42]